MAFDPSQPFEVEGQGGFDPSKPFTTSRARPVRRMGADRAAESRRDAGEAGYSIANPVDLSGGYQGASLPIGGFYRDAQGNVRRNENGLLRPDGKPQGNPIVKPVGTMAKRGIARAPGQEVEGALSQLNAGLLIGDEISAALGTGYDVLRGKAAPLNVKPGESPLDMSVTLRTLGDTFKRRMEYGEGVQDDFRARRPGAAGLARGTGTAATVLVPGAGASQLAATPSRGAAALQGATVGAAQGAAAGLLDRGSLDDRLSNATRGGAIGAVTGGVLGGLTAPGRPRPVRKPAPTLDELRAMKNDAYRAVDTAGVRYSPEAYGALAKEMRLGAQVDNIDPIVTPRSARLLDVAEERAASGWSPSLSELDNLRKAISRGAANSTDPAEQYFGREMIREIDDFVASPQAMAEGSSGDAASLIERARNLNTRYRKVQDVTRAVDSAELRAGSTNSGGNIDNAIRQNLRRILENSRNLSPEEQQALRDIVLGTPGQNLLRTIGKLSPQGNGLMAALNLGATGTGGAVGGPIGAVVGATPGAAGIVSKHIADGITQRRVAQLIDLMATGGSPGAEAADELAALAARDPAVAAAYQELVARASRSAASVGQGDPASRARPIRAASGQ